MDWDWSRYGRIVGRVYVGSADVSRELVAPGIVWVYRKYSNDAQLLALEAEARERGWRLRSVVFRERWRRRMRRSVCLNHDLRLHGA